MKYTELVRMQKSASYETIRKVASLMKQATQPTARQGMVQGGGFVRRSLNSSPLAQSIKNKISGASDALSRRMADSIKADPEVKKVFEYLDPSRGNPLEIKAPVTKNMRRLRQIQRYLPGKPRHVRNAIYNILQRQKWNAKEQAEIATAPGTIARNTAHNFVDNVFNTVSYPFMHF